jgi:hypothetical protein
MGFAMALVVLQLKNIGSDFHRGEFQINICLIQFIESCKKVAHFRVYCHLLNVQCDLVEEKEGTVQFM